MAQREVYNFTLNHISSLRKSQFMGSQPGEPQPKETKSMRPQLRKPISLGIFSLTIFLSLSHWVLIFRSLVLFIIKKLKKVLKFFLMKLEESVN